MKQWLKSFAKEYGVFILVMVLFFGFFAPLTTIGSSMNETLIDGDILMLRRTKTVERGDIIQFQSDIKIDEYHLSQLNWFQRLTVGENMNLVKRVVALPGEHVEMIQGLIFIDGNKLEETYISHQANEIYLDFGIVPENTLFVLGDNRPVSKDSRSKDVGFVDQDSVKGRVTFRFWPLSRIGNVHS
ncbi:signal peptidase I [Gottschalkiaceae bacterium SANA]|nr:signal peptidase I [Gottschalkiaceae bacterium SANA]